MTKTQTKQQIAKLVEKYKKILEEGRIKEYNEAQTRNEFIEPLFEFLGWDMRNLNNANEVSTEEAVSNKRVDLGFRISGIPQFFLEAKPLKADLDNEDYARQAINYSWNKGVSWAVLTDFESLKIFNAQAESRLLSDKLVFELKCDTYLDDFDRLWLLSKESFKENKLDEYAVKYGKKIKKLTVNEKLFKDLTSAREILTKSFKMWNEKVDQETLDEGVQRILDRLVFIRVLEDKGLEPPTLKEILHGWESDKKSKQFFPLLIDKFRELNDIYNSNIFTKHPCEEWEEYDDSLKKVILMLYGNNVYEYDFKEIPADILGGVYENYLSYVQSRGDAKGKARAKRKEHGIYYTPKYIVEYIVNNTLGKKLEEVNSMHELKKIKVLDPACGSGSFLTKSLETINNKYKDFNNKGDQDTKSEILLSNIYGVDLDAQAVELARLNLLIDALDKKAKLPNLTGNIRQGNSLISGDPKELEKYFGKNYRELHPFNWQEQFKDVFDKDGFDVIVSNPPYVAITGIDYDTRRIYEKMYETAVGRFDLFALFIERSIKLLKNGGHLGFIIPNKFLTNDQSKKSREFILNNGCVIAILHTAEKIFADASVNNIVLIFEKIKDENKKCKIYVIEKGKPDQIGEVSNKKFANDSEKRFIILQESGYSKLMDKIKVKSTHLGEIADIKDGIVAGRIKDLLFKEDKTSKNCKPLLFGENINRYLIKFTDNYVDYRKNFMMQKEEERAHGKRIGLWMRDENIFLRPKILTRKTADRIIATFDDENYYYEQTLHSTYVKDKNYSPYYILALLNSKLFKFYYQKIINQSGTLFPQVRISFLKQLPIKIADSKQQKIFVDLSMQMLDLNKKLHTASENSEKWLDLKREIEKLDKEIDEEVYKLYGLTPEEIKVVEK